MTIEDLDRLAKLAEERADGWLEETGEDIRWMMDRPGFGELLYLACLPGVDPHCYKLWAIIRVHENRKIGHAWPSRRRLADFLGVRKTETVDRHLKHLENAGLLLLWSGGKAGRTNRYKTVAPQELVAEGRARLTGATLKSREGGEGSPAERGRGDPRSTGEGAPS